MHEFGQKVGYKWDNHKRTFPWHGLSNDKPKQNCLKIVFHILSKLVVYFRLNHEQPYVSVRRKKDYKYTHKPIIGVCKKTIKIFIFFSYQDGSTE